MTKSSAASPEEGGVPSDKQDTQSNDPERMSSSSPPPTCMSSTPSSKDATESSTSVDEGAAPANQDDGAHSTLSPHRHEPTLFADENGHLKFVKMVVRCPCLIFWSILSTCIIMSLILVAILIHEGNPFRGYENEFELNDERSIQYDSLRLAVAEVVDWRDAGGSASQNGIRVQSKNRDVTYWVFETQREDEGGLFATRESIANMKEAYDLFTDNPDYANYCRLEYPDDGGAPFCAIPLTPLTIYYASEWNTSLVDSVIARLQDEENVSRFNSLSPCVVHNLYCEKLPHSVTEEDSLFVGALFRDVTAIVDTWDLRGDLVDNITQATQLAAHLTQVDAFKRFANFGYDKNFGVENPHSKFSRGLVFWGGPLNLEGEGETGATVIIDEEEGDNKREQDDEARTTFVTEEFLDLMKEQAKTSTHSDLNSYYFMRSLILDVLLEIVIMDGLLAIFSMIFVVFWLRINLGSWFLSFVGLLEILFSVPVAWFFYTAVFRIKFFAFLNVVSIFIVGAIGADDIFIFMDSYRQSATRNPENLTSMDARMTWVYRRSGAAMAITSATTCAAFLCTLITPLASIRSLGIFSAFVIFFDYVLVMSLFCTAVVIYHDRYETKSCFGSCCTNGCGRTDPSPTMQAREHVTHQGQEVGGDRVSNFFRNRFSSFIQILPVKIGLLIFFLSWLGVAAWQASKIEATKETEQHLDEDHPLQKSITIINSEFPVAEQDDSLQVYFAWGLGLVDRNGVNILTNPKYFGEPAFEPTFDFNEECQVEMLSACDMLRTDPKYHGLIKRKNGLGLVHCFVEELGAFNANGGERVDCPTMQQGEWKNTSWAVAPENLAGLMGDFINLPTCRTEDPETMINYYENSMGWDGERIRFAAIMVESEVLDPLLQLPESVTRMEYDQFVDIAHELDTMLGPKCSGTVVMTDLNEKFAFMNNQAIYVRSAFQSSALGVAVAFVVLFMSTRVMHIAFFASLSIMSVLISVVGTMVMLGWNLGSIESVLISITAGFSVDYCVHLAHSYRHAIGDTNKRIRAAFGDMGISVLNGMITSVVGSIPLFFCRLQFFAKFGTFLCLIIAFSWIFANFGLMTMLGALKLPIRNRVGRCGFSL